MHRRNAQGGIYTRGANPTHTRAVSGKLFLLLIVLFSMPASCFVVSAIWPGALDSTVPVTIAQSSGIPQVVAYRPTADGDVIIVSGDGFAKGEPVSILAVPANADLTKQQRWPILAQANADSDGRISVILNREQLRRSPYAKVYFWVQSQHDQLHTAEFFDLSNLAGLPEVAPASPPIRPDVSATPNPLVWQREIFEQPTLTGSISPPASVKDIACTRGDLLWRTNGGSASWTQQVEVGLFSNYIFALTALGGSRLYIDDNPVPLIDEWRQSDKPATYKAHIHLTKGTHRLRLDYFRSRRGCSIKLRWRQEFPNWRADLYDNDNLDGPVMAVVALDSIPMFDPNRISDPSLDLNVTWDVYTIAEVKPDHFSANIYRTVAFTQTGTYRIQLTVGADDQARLYIKQKPVFGEWANSGPRFMTYEFKRGVNYPMQLQFKDTNGLASIQLTFELISN